MARYLFDNWSKISFQLKKKDKILLISDYDGTLTPIVSHPDLARLTNQQINFIHQIAKNNKIIFGILSGRPLADLKNKIGISGILYSGNHGLEIQTNRKKFVHPAAKRSKKNIKKIRDQLNIRIKHIPGAWVEDKGLTLSIHYRQVNVRNIVRLKKMFTDVTQNWVNRIKITYGKKVFEIRPPIAWDKGKAIEWIVTNMQKHRPVKLLPVYIGDDRTDEDAFRIVSKNGISIHVGRKNTLAEYRVNGVEEVYRFFRIVNKTIAMTK